VPPQDFPLDLPPPKKNIIPQVLLHVSRTGFTGVLLQIAIHNIFPWPFDILVQSK